VNHIRAEPWGLMDKLQSVAPQLTTNN